MENAKSVEEWNEMRSKLTQKQQIEIDTSGLIVKVLGRDLRYNNNQYWVSEFYRQHNLEDPLKGS